MDLLLGTGIYWAMHRDVERADTGDGRGLGLFITKPITVGTVLWHCEESEAASLCREEIRKLPQEEQEIFASFCWQLDDDLFEGPLTQEQADADASHFWNHSCDPSAWIADDVTIVARRDLASGDEITTDYATWLTCRWLMGCQLPMACGCGTALCRGTISADDWQRPELQERYGEHFVAFILRKINAARAGAQLREPRPDPSRTSGPLARLSGQNAQLGGHGA